MVLGSHDHYLADRIAIDDYGLSSNRVNEFKAMVKKEKDMYLLDGNVIEIDGVRIGGAMGWYDGRYVHHNLNPQLTKNRQYLENLWFETNPDVHHIFGLDTFDGYLEDEMQKIEAVHKNCDIMVTHINPSIKDVHTARHFRRAGTTGFFTFDGTSFLMNTSAKYWIFGHSHDQSMLVRHEVKCVLNPLGYPNEHSKSFQIRSIEL